jgi:SAM-dependent methyltransferase
MIEVRQISKEHESGDNFMPADKSLWHYGQIYNKIIDPMIKPSRDVIVALISRGASVLDIGCGTGRLCFELMQQRRCRVVGIDLSTRMLSFAQKNNPYESVKFLHQDATNMEDFQANSFDYVVASHFIHELTKDKQLKMLKEAGRVGRKVILLDATAPLPWNFFGVFKRFFELLFGYDHYPQFKAYLDSGGILGLLAEAHLEMKILHKSTFGGDSMQVAVISN